MPLDAAAAFAPQRRFDRAAPTLPRVLKAPPPRGLPLTCIAFALASLATAMLVTVLRAEEIAGATMHPTTLLVVHLITVGFLLPVITGATWIVLPLAFGVRLPASGWDWAAALSICIGGLGVASHFVFGGYDGMAWSGLMIVAGAISPAWHVTRRLLLGSSSALLFRVPIPLAWLHLFLAAGLGILLALDRREPFLPGGHVAALAGHAHLAGVGFALSMFVGVGYRLLPMVLPARPPRTHAAWIPVLLLGPGSVLFALGKSLGWQLAARAAAIGIAAGLITFVAILLSLDRRAPPPPRDRPQPDLPSHQLRVAVLWLAVAAALGIGLLLADAPRPAFVAGYGCAALLGFFVTAILAILPRIVGWFAWLRQWQGSRGQELPPRSAHGLSSRWLQRLVTYPMLLGTVLAFYGCVQGSAVTLRLGALCIGLATLACAGELIWIHRSLARSRAAALESSGAAP